MSKEKEDILRNASEEYHLRKMVAAAGVATSPQSPNLEHHFDAYLRKCRLTTQLRVL